MKAAALLLPLVAVLGLAYAAPSLYPGLPPGKAQASATPTGASMGNDAFTATYAVKEGAVTFEGLKAADGTALIDGSTPLFSISLGDGRVFDSTNMKGSGLSVRSTGTPAKAEGKGKKKSKKKGLKAEEASSGSGGKLLRGTFLAPDGSFAIVWNGVLDNGSHYLRHSLSIRSKEPLEINQITALDFNASPSGGTPTVSGNTTHGCVVVNDKLFFGLETPMSVMSVGGRENKPTSTWNPAAWNDESFGPAFNLPDSFRKAYGSRYAETDGPVLARLKQAEGPVSFTKSGTCRLIFRPQNGQAALRLLGVQLLDAEGKLLSEDVHEGIAGQKSGCYTLNVPKPGPCRLRYWVQAESKGSGRVSFSLPLAAEGEDVPTQIIATKVLGNWQRRAPLSPGQTWSATGVVGLLAPGQHRRSFLAYIERERAVRYRPFVHYNDWYEIGIRVHDFKDPAKRTNEAMWMDVLEVWNKELCVKRRTKLDGFIVDDGWDEFNSLWDFHCGFPNGFSKLAKKARRMGAGIGTWLGPVGGYGASKSMRINYWNSKHPNNRIDNFQLSNKEYFDAFVGRCLHMIKAYDMRYFKFDGISTKFHAKGPAAIEDAEGILNVIHALREEKQDIFINATVGTWASPFWYMHADSTWRQENDFGQAGNAGDERDRWITYRDRLVHEVYVQGAPLCPLNSLMTHGTIITKNGPPRIMSKEPENCRKEIRMAFGSGSALQEIYADNDLLSQQDGLLWSELAANIAWVRRNADVLPDVHWVGGTPWDGKDGSIYGYAAWNKKKATLTLRNSSGSEKTLQTTLREMLDVPPGIKGTVTFRNSHKDQRELGLTKGELEVDAPLTITMQPLEVIVLEGRCGM